MRQIISDMILSPFRGFGFLCCLCRGFHPCLWYAVPFGTFEASFYLTVGEVWASDITSVVTDDVTDDTDCNMAVKNGWS